jgi:hypothetical protein
MTPRQADYVHRAANLLPAAAQAQFLRSVGNMLGYAEYPLNDRDVLDCLRLVLARHQHRQRVARAQARVRAPAKGELPCLKATSISTVADAS